MAAYATHPAGVRCAADDRSSYRRGTGTRDNPALGRKTSKSANPYDDNAETSVPCPVLGPANEIAINRIALTSALAQPPESTTTNVPPSHARLELSPLGNSHADPIASPRLSATCLPEEHNSLTLPVSQEVPSELGSLLAEIIFVLTCTAGQVISSLIVGHITVTQTTFRKAFGIPPTQTPWLIGSSVLASGLSVIISGSLADLTPPRPLMIGAFLWGAIWNAVNSAAVSPNLKILFFLARVMNGLAVGVLVTTSMSILGRVYNPGVRKTRVFSFMAAGSPLGFWVGCMQGGGGLYTHISPGSLGAHQSFSRSVLLLPISASLLCDRPVTVLSQRHLL